MPVLGIDARDEDLRLHGSAQPVAGALKSALASTTGPLAIMTHGYRFQPGHWLHCPHDDVLSADAADSWPREMGLAGDGGLAIGLGWDARCRFAVARQRAVTAGRALARLIGLVHRLSGGRRTHLVAHSLGAEPVLEALARAPRGAVGRVLLMTGASYASRAAAALASPAGRTAELINLTSRENDPFDFLFQRLVPAPEAGDRPLGQGFEADNAVTLRIDCPATLERLAPLGARIDPSARRICHWSIYRRPGALAFYGALLRDPRRLSLAALRRARPEPKPEPELEPRPRRLWPGLPLAQKTA